MKIVMCNCPQDKAHEIARKIVEQKIAACVNVIPNVTSYYHWENSLCVDQEATLIIKIRHNSFHVLEKKIQEWHPYDVPEIVEINISNVNSAYLKWLYSNC